MKRAVRNVFKIFPILKERKNQMAGTLSGGQQQMVAIGRDLCRCHNYFCSTNLLWDWRPVGKRIDGYLSQIKEET
jgi:predicted ABC-type transport system involved in lysophospholipase L1 biosynthesis ATPase subunit